MLHILTMKQIFNIIIQKNDKAIGSQIDRLILLFPPCKWRAKVTYVSYQDSMGHFYSLWYDAVTRDRTRDLALAHEAGALPSAVEDTIDSVSVNTNVF